MKIDLHVHTSSGSDGNLAVEDVIGEARKRGVELLSITDHDSIDAQPAALSLSRKAGIRYVVGVELNVTFQYPGSKAASLDFLGYRFDLGGEAIRNKLQIIRERREQRARQILKNLNEEFLREGIDPFTEKDIANIQATVDGAFGRPHIANYLVSKGIVRDKQEAFDRYLVKCDVPKYPLSLEEASSLIRNAGGILVHAHPSDPNGTSLTAFASSVEEQIKIIETYMLPYLDGIECWHPRHDASATSQYIRFATKHKLVMTGGSDCHQKPILIGTVPVPDYVADSFAEDEGRNRDLRRPRRKS